MTDPFVEDFAELEIMLGREHPMADLDRSKITGGVMHKNERRKKLSSRSGWARSSALRRWTRERSDGALPCASRSNYPTGRSQWVKTTARLFVQAADAIRKKYPEVDNDAA